VTDTTVSRSSATLVNALARARPPADKGARVAVFVLSCTVGLALMVDAMKSFALSQPITSRQYFVLDTVVQKVSALKGEPTAQVWRRLELRFGAPADIPRAGFDAAVDALVKQLDDRPDL